MSTIGTSPESSYRKDRRAVWGITRVVLEWRRVGLVALAWCLMSPETLPRVLAGPVPTVEDCIRLFDAKKFPEAKTAFESVARADPRSAVALYYLGRLLMREQAFDQAVERFEKAVEVEDLNSTYHLWLGRAYGQKALRANVFKQALLAGKVRTQFERAVDLDPSNLEARSALVSFYLQAPGIMGGSTEKALAQAAEIQKRDLFKGYLVLASIHDHEKKTDLAEQDLLSAIKVNSASLEPRFQLGYLYQRLERYQDAFRVFEEIAATGEGRLAGLYQIGRTGVLSGEHLDRAAESLTLYLREDPGEGLPAPAWAHFRLGQVYEKQGKTELARDQYQSAVRLAPDHKEAQQALKKLPPATATSTRGK